MKNLSSQGLNKLRRFITENGTSRVVEAFSHTGMPAWIDSIDEDGHLEMHARFAANGVPATIRFEGDDFLRPLTDAEREKSRVDFWAGNDDAKAGKPLSQPRNHDYVSGYITAE